MRRLLTIVTCLLITGMALADKVSEMEALKKAQAFMPGERFEVQKYSTSVGGKTVEEPFYIFNATNGRGFVLVSAEDRTTPILGYSTNSNIDLDNIPNNLRYWLESYAEQLKAIEEGTPVATSRAGTRGARGNIEPLIQTRWNQGEQYNLMCPDGDGVDYNKTGYKASNRCVTGCVATAVAQVMYYYKWPEQTTEIPSYKSSAINATLEALPATTLEWSKMKDKYDDTETGEEAWAVAKLMRYVGQALKMNYNISDKGGSGANIYEDIMIETFNYSKNMHTRNRNEYTTTGWEDMVYNELDSRRPVLYSGRTKNSGHQFVCDGYKDGLFHLNWGWGGSLDGYFILSIADPNGEQGIGGSNGAFKYSQDATFNFKPATPDEEDIPIMTSAISTCDPSSYTRSSASEDFTIASLPGRYYYYYYTEPTTTYNAEIGWGLYQGEQLMKCFEPSIQEFNKDGQYSYKANQLTNASFGAGLADGRYQLQQIYRKAGSSDDWTLMDKNGINYYVAEISGNTLTIRIADTSIENFRVNSITISDEPAAGMDMDVTVNITNTSDAITENIYLWTAPKGSTSWTKVAEQTAYYDPDESGDVSMTFQPTKSGTFTLKVTTSTSDVALATQDFTVAPVVKLTYNGISISCIPTYGKAVITSGGSDNSKTSVTIPATVTVSGTECRVTAIAEQAFYNWYRLKTIDIPEGVETIGNKAFMCCYGVRKIVLPSTLKSIGENAFYRADDLSEVISRIQVPFAIGDDTFKKYDFDLQTTIPSGATLYVPFGTKSAYQAFAGWTAFKAIEEGDIKEATVGGLNYRYYTGAKKAVVIAGDYSSMTTVEIPASVTIDGVDYSVKAIDEEVFSDNKNLQTISLPDGLEEIGSYAFMSASYLNEFAIPSHLKHIGDYAFFNCNRIYNVILPEGLETLGGNVFAYCYGLQKLELPSTLSSVGQGIIKGCSALTTVVSHIEVPFQISDNTFAFESSMNQTTGEYDITPSPATLFVPIGTIKAYQAIKGWTTFKVIEEGEIKEDTVDGLSYSYSTGSKKATVIAGDYGGLTELVIPAKVTIDDVEYTVKAIGAEAFSRCANLGTVSLPDGLKTIGNNAFFNCYRLTTVNLSKKLESIGDYAFAYCFWLEEIELPSSLKSIGKRAFYGDNSLEKVTSRILNPFEIGEDTFKDYNNPSPATLYVPAGTKSKYKDITGWTVFQGGIEEMEPGNGDADGDGNTTMSDAMAILSYILGGNPDGFDAAAVDMNGDGIVTVTDIILILMAYNLIP